MADAVTSQTLMDGAKVVVMKFTSASDGTGESGVVKVDVSALSGAPTSVKIMRMWYSTNGMGARLLWHADTSVLAWVIPESHSGEFDFTSFGGIQNNAGTGVNGDIKLSTFNQSSGDSYSFILEMHKTYG